MTAVLLRDGWATEKDDGFLEVAAEHVRSALYSSPDGISSGALSSRIRNLAACVAPHLLNNDNLGESKFIRTILRNLERVGDLYLSDGKILLSRPRLIHAGAKDDHILVAGGLPTSLIRSRFGVTAKTMGLARFLRRKDLTNSRRFDENIWQNAFDWLGIWCRDLVGWTGTIVAHSLEEAHSGSPLGAEVLEILDVATRGTRWVRLASYRGQPRGPHLCRARDSSARGGYRYYLVLLEADSGVLEVCASKELQRWDGVRLRFGIAALHGTFTEISARRTSTQIILKNPIPLPIPENRIFSLGSRDASQSSRYELSFPIELEQLLSSVLDKSHARLSS